MASGLTARFLEFVREGELFRPGESVVAAVSGGGDSVALLFLLVECRPDLRVVVAHFDHRMRADSGRDREFARRLADRLGLAVRVGQAVEPPRSEEAARDLRRAFLLETARSLGASAVALAHQADDQAETVLQRALRGRGPRGLAAITPRGLEAGVAVVRPLLFATGEDLRAFLRARGEAWVEDPTNASEDQARSWLRHRVLAALPPPLFPGAARNLAALARREAEIDDFLRAEASRRWQGIRAGPPDPATLEGRLWPPRLLGARSSTADRAGFLALEPALVHPVLSIALAEIGAPSPTDRVRRQVEGAVRAGRGADLPGPVRLVVDGARFHLVGGLHAEPPRAPEREIAPGVRVPLPALGLCLDLRRRSPPGPLDVGPWASVLAHREGRYALRPRKGGDRYRPLGAPGAKPLAEVLTDRKVPPALRDALPVLTLEDRPIWMPGLPPDESARANPPFGEVLVARLVVE